LFGSRRNLTKLSDEWRAIVQYVSECDNSYEENTQLNKCDLSAHCTAVSSKLIMNLIYRNVQLKTVLF